MSTSGVGSTGSSSSSSSSAASNSTLAMTPSDFINLLVTQLQNQDPTSPMSNSDMLNQVSQISQLQSSNTLTTTLQGLTLQNQIGSASNLIGKSVKGTDANNNAIGGVVTSVSVAGQNVNLELDSGSSLSLGNVTEITPSTSATGTPTPTTGS